MMNEASERELDNGINTPNGETETEKNIFICYARKDRGTVEPIIGALRENGYCVWYDNDLPHWENWLTKIADEIRKSGAFMFFVSDNSMQSVYCTAEYLNALSNRIPILPVFLVPKEDEERLLKDELLGYVKQIHVFSQSAYRTREELIKAICGEAQLAPCRRKQLVIPENKRSIGESEYRGRRDIHTVRLHDKVESIDDWGFYHCDNLRQISGLGGVKELGEGAFGECWLLRELDLPGGVTTIRHYALHACKSLERIDLPDSVTEIGYMGVSFCSALRTVRFSKGLKVIGDRAFCSCPRLADPVLPEGLERIGRKAFSDCTSLTELEIPASVTYVGDRAFDDCTSLKRIIINAGKVPDGWHPEWLGNCKAQILFSCPTAF